MLFRFFIKETVLFSVQGWTIYIVEVISNQSKFGKYSAKIGYMQCNISIVALYVNGELRLKLSFLDIILHKKTTNWTSNRIMIVKIKYIFEVETPLHHAICPPMRWYFKPIWKQLVSFISTKKWCTVFVSLWVESYQGNACNSQGKHVQQKYLLEKSTWERFFI